MGDDVRNKLSTALNQLDTWIEKEKFQGWDPYDALNSPILKTLSFENRLAGIIWVQLLKRLPVNLRSLLRVPKGYNPKGMGLFLSSYLRKFQMTGDKTHLEKVDFFSQWLRENISPGYSGACWGYNFDWPNRVFYAPAGVPTVVTTGFIGIFLLELARAAQNHPELVQEDFTPAELACSACDFVLLDLNRSSFAEDEICFSYTPMDTSKVHNANLLGGQLLAEVFQFGGQKDASLAENVLRCTRYSVRRQRSDGAWIYGEDGNNAWVDNFHTGYVLLSLRKIGQCLETNEFNVSVEKGYKFWKYNFFLPDGIPKYYDTNTYPIDIHCVAQAILTFIGFRDMDAEALSIAQHVANWGIEKMQDPQGFFYFQRNRHYVNRIPYMRWAQAWMQQALIELSMAEDMINYGRIENNLV